MTITKNSGAPSPQPDGAAEGGWEPTRAQSMMATQIMRGADEAEDDTTARDIGRPVGDNVRELFVSCGPAEALRQQFEILHPEFIAVHDVGTALSRKLLAGIAAASGRSVQRLVIRRQGYGTPLATLEFIEWPTAQGTALRLYTTEADADTASRAALAMMLLAHSQLGVMLVGDLPVHALTTALQPLQQALARGPWPNRHLLMLPLSSASAVAAQSAHLSGPSGVTVRTTPQVQRPAQAWGFISATWNQMHDSDAARGMQLPGVAAGPAAAGPAVTPTAPAAVPGPSNPSAPQAGPVSPLAAAQAALAAATAPVAAPASPPAAAPVTPLPMRPMPAVPGPGAAPRGRDDVRVDHLGRRGKLNGMLACAVFDTATSRLRAHAGTAFDGERLAHQGRALIDAARRSADGLGVPPGTPETTLTLAAHHVMLRPIARHPDLALIAVFDARIANLTLVRLQIQRHDEDFAP
jgi:hypothetical protein